MGESYLGWEFSLPRTHRASVSNFMDNALCGLQVHSFYEHSRADHQWHVTWSILLEWACHILCAACHLFSAGGHVIVCSLSVSASGLSDGGFACHCRLLCWLPLCASSTVKKLKDHFVFSAYAHSETFLARDLLKQWARLHQSVPLRWS